VNPRLAIFNVKTMDEVLADSLWEINLYRWLIGLFAALVLVLAAIGLYGVVSCSVTSRLREFALRLALGANQLSLSQLVVRRGVRLVAMGLGVGATASLWLLALLGDLPLGSRPDAALMVSIAALLILVAVAACAAPARRVAAIDAVTALRDQ
jgi:putative ABC transport system permease protein